MVKKNSKSTIPLMQTREGKHKKWGKMKVEVKLKCIFTLYVFNALDVYAHKLITKSVIYSCDQICISSIITPVFMTLQKSL